jgi:hypothetical protein
VGIHLSRSDAPAGHLELTAPRPARCAPSSSRHRMCRLVLTVAGASSATAAKSTDRAPSRAAAAPEQAGISGTSSSNTTSTEPRPKRGCRLAATTTPSRRVAPATAAWRTSGGSADISRAQRRVERTHACRFFVPRGEGLLSVDTVTVDEAALQVQRGTHTWESFLTKPGRVSSTLVRRGRWPINPPSPQAWPARDASGRSLSSNAIVAHLAQVG